ncbi:MAG: alanine racemase, partial [Chitinophagaceae bacterium]
VFQFEQIGRLLEQKVHQTVLEIDQNALLHNLNEYQKFIRPETRLMAMVKAFSYGSGSYEIANLLQFQKVDYLAVAYADEGVDLRKAGITIPIMVMNPEENTFDTLQLYDLEPDIYSFGLLESFSNFLRKKRIEKYPIHIEIETGMNRLGFPSFEVEKLAEHLKHSVFLVKSVFSHLVASEDPLQDDFTRHQAWLYFEACDKIHRITGFHFLRHLANSAAIIRHPDLQLDMVRLGIGLYGVAGINHPDLDLVEATTLRTTIAQIKSLRAGESVGYGRKGMVHHDSLVATVRLGYADGYPRRLSNGKGHMWVRGKLAPVIGNICMDMAMIDITGIQGVSEGDVVIVFGKELSVSQLAAWAETIPYEIMTGISQRVKRVYYE